MGLFDKLKNAVTGGGAKVYVDWGWDTSDIYNQRTYFTFFIIYICNDFYFVGTIFNKKY